MKTKIHPYWKSAKWPAGFYVEATNLEQATHCTVSSGGVSVQLYMDGTLGPVVDADPEDVYHVDFVCK